ncbi:MAG: 2-thiouracil desulfurase family protein [Planctomycetota bacterium]
MAKVLISACLTGRACRYDGRDARHVSLVDALGERSDDVVAFCPEEAAGLGTPRPAARLHGGDGEAVLDGRARVVTDEGDATDAFLDGARQAVEYATEQGCTVAYLKERSPSCGCAAVHTDDGLTRGCGVTTALLRRAGIATVSVS